MSITSEHPVHGARHAPPPPSDGGFDGGDKRGSSPRAVSDRYLDTLVDDFDKDGSGELELKELARMLSKFSGQKISESDALMPLSLLDTDDSKGVSSRELRDAVGAGGQAPPSVDAPATTPKQSHSSHRNKGGHDNPGSEESEPEQPGGPRNESGSGGPAASAPTGGASTSAPTDARTASDGPVQGASSLKEAAANTKPQFKPILRGDEAQVDASIKSQEDFGRFVDQTAREYGLDPNQFRAQLERESNAFSKGYQYGMNHEGDLDRASDNNTSIGLGQISKNFLDGGPWSDVGPNNPRVGGQTVSEEQYRSSVAVQVRTAAAHDAMRAQDHGGLEPGLAYYVNGSPDTGQQKARDYLDAIEGFMNDPNVIGVGR
jgi:hypothetical protein